MKILGMISKRISKLSWIKSLQLRMRGIDPVEYEKQRESEKLMDEWMKSQGYNKIIDGSESFTLTGQQMFNDWNEKKEDEDPKKVKWFL